MGAIEIDTKKLAEELAREQQRVPAPENGAGDRPLPPGCIRYPLSVNDRLLILHALEAYWRGKEGKDSRADYKGIRRLAQARDALDAEGVEAYLEAIQDTLAQRREEWQDQIAAYEAWRRAGRPADQPVKRPPAREPKLTPEEVEGPVGTYTVTSQTDVDIRTALKAMDWRQYAAKAARQVLDKFGIKEE